jgi:two-component system, cell cycle response regulator DivK
MTSAPDDIILLVDDFVDGLDLYTEWLTFKGYRVVTAADGASAIARARENRPALILMDIRMPIMTGREAAKVLRSDPTLATVPLVALTAHALQEEREELLATGFDAVLSKPVLPDELIAAIDDIFRRSRSA